MCQENILLVWKSRSVKKESLACSDWRLEVQHTADHFPVWVKVQTLTD